MGSFSAFTMPHCLNFPNSLIYYHLSTNLHTMRCSTPAHIAQHHSKVNAILTMVRQQYWIPSGRQHIRSLLHTCVICRRHAGRPYPTPDPSPLVKCRVNTVLPFEATGVDLWGRSMFGAAMVNRRSTCVCSHVLYP